METDTVCISRQTYDLLKQTQGLNRDLRNELAELKQKKKFTVFIKGEANAFFSFGQLESIHTDSTAVKNIAERLVKIQDEMEKMKDFSIWKFMDWKNRNA